jgi:hypothetical protein
VVSAWKYKCFSIDEIDQYTLLEKKTLSRKTFENLQEKKHFLRKINFISSYFLKKTRE